MIKAGYLCPVVTIGHLRFFSSNVWTLFRILQPRDRTDWIRSFSLSDKRQVRNISNTKTIEFDTDKEGTVTWLKGFRVHTTNATEVESEIKAMRIASKLEDIISVRSGVAVRVNPTGYNKRISPDRWLVQKTTTFKWQRRALFDLDLAGDPNLSCWIFQDKMLNQRLYHVKAGLLASEHLLYDTMIIEFFQAIEGVEPTLTTKFEPLRNALSHPEQLKKCTRTALVAHFGIGHFDLTPNFAFDYNSPKNLEALKKAAEDLMDKTLGFSNRSYENMHEHD